MLIHSPINSHAGNCRHFWFPSIADLPRNLKILCVYMRGPNRPEVGDLSGAEHPAMGGDEHDIIIDTLRQRRNNALSVSRDLYASSPCPAQEIL